MNLIVSKSDASVEFSMSIFALCPSAFQSGERTYFFPGGITGMSIAKFHGMEARLFGSLNMDLSWELYYRLNRIV